jgi:hypothetical protein
MGNNADSKGIERKLCLQTAINFEEEIKVELPLERIWTGTRNDE